MKSAQPLDGDNAALLQQGKGARDRVAGNRFAGAFEATQLRAAIGAGIGLGMEAPAGWLPVFLPAGRAEREFGHARCGPVIGQRRSDAVAGAATCAMRKGVAVTTILRIEEFFQAIATDGCILRDSSAHGTSLAGGD